jgi:hypothetical protein
LKASTPLTKVNYLIYERGPFIYFFFTHGFSISVTKELKLTSERRSGNVEENGLQMPLRMTNNKLWLSVGMCQEFASLWVILLFSFPSRCKLFGSAPLGALLYVNVKSNIEHHKSIIRHLLGLRIFSLIFTKN